MRLILGYCDNCKMRGVLTRKAVMPEITLSDVIDQDADHSRPIDTLMVCETCKETPAGCRSENLGHKRARKSRS